VRDPTRHGARGADIVHWRCRWVAVDAVGCRNAGEAVNFGDAGGLDATVCDRASAAVC
jgi:hypothetical protein